MTEGAGGPAAAAHEQVAVWLAPHRRRYVLLWTCRGTIAFHGVAIDNPRAWLAAFWHAGGP